MKSIRKVLGGLLLIVGFIALFNLLHAQETATPLQSGAVSTVDWNTVSDEQVLLEAVEQTPAIPADEATNGNTFWSASHAPGSAEPFPPFPGNVNNLPAWPLWSVGNPGSNVVYLLSDENFDYTAPRRHHRTRQQASLSSSLSSAGSSMAMAMDMNPADGGDDTNDDGDTNSYAGANFSPMPITTNDLWLQLVCITNQTASLIIHPPWNVTNGICDLWYCTNLTAPISWQWLLRSDPGQTNLIVPNATDAHGFYRLSLI
jgi:hypothetical protein